MKLNKYRLIHLFHALVITNKQRDTLKVEIVKLIKKVEGKIFKLK